MRARNSPFFLIFDYDVSAGEAIAINFLEFGTHIAFSREVFIYQLLNAGFLLALLALIHSILLFPPSYRPRTSIQGLLEPVGQVVIYRIASH